MKKIAVCMCGHIRTFSLCYTNIYENFIKKLVDNGYTVDFFISIWDVKGERNNWNEKVNFDCLTNLNPKALLIENFDRNNFLNKFNSEKWKEYSHLCGPTTCGDSVSMWYKVQTCWNMVINYEKRYSFEYNIISRIRPDIFFDTIFDTSILEDIEINNVVYIPKWHKKFIEVCLTFTDYFAIGNRKVMSKYMSVYNNIEYFIKCNEYPHTGEGFLYGQLENENVKRLNTGFTIKRFDKDEKIFN